MKKKIIVAQWDDRGALSIGEVDPSALGISPDDNFHMSSNEPSELEKTYARLREQVNAENQLYTQRIYWLIFIQAFLFATSGLVLQAILEPTASNLNGFLVAFLAVVALLGIFVGMVCHYIFKGARDALGEIGGLWSDAVAASDEEDLTKRFPHVRGGKIKDNQERGPERHNLLFRSGNLGLAFVAAWIALGALGYAFLL